MNRDVVAQKMIAVLREVELERYRQEARWGKQNHLQIIWLGILAEEVGEAAKGINELHFRSGPLYANSDPRNSEPNTMDKQQARIRTELIQVAAVAAAMIESLDRNGR